MGRNAAGTGNSGNETFGSNVARPARLIYSIGGPSGDGFLRNITSVTGGSVSGYALDVDGYVWAWGDGGWGGLTGQGQFVNHSDPRIVLKGVVTSGFGQDGKYLLAKSISAGLGFAMAVTLDGMPVAWGNNSCSANAIGPGATPNFGCGGNLGNAGLGSSNSAPVYIQYGAGNVHSDVISISAGFNWGYYLREDNFFWAWGDNVVGQLGIGNYTTQNRAVSIPQIATGCSQPDPVPFANLTPYDTIVCESKLASNNIRLESTFKVSPVLLSNYQFTWYRVFDPASLISSFDTLTGNIVKEGNRVNFSTLDVVTKGRYWLRIKCMGLNSTCGGYPTSYDYSTIDVFPNSFATKSDLNYCSASAEVSISPGLNSQ